MEPYQNLLLGTPLFAGFGPGQLGPLLALLAPTLRRYQKGQVLLMAGAEAEELGVVLEGAAQAVKYTRAGGQFTVARFGPGGVFGDVLAVGSAKSPVTLTAEEPLAALFIRQGRLFSPAATPAENDLLRRLLANLVGVLSDKYFALDRRVDLLLIKGLSRRLAAFLLDAAGPAGLAGAPFTIPYNRAGLAAYLGCERSALSRELGALVRRGLVETRRSSFRLPNAEGLRTLF